MAHKNWVRGPEVKILSWVKPSVEPLSLESFSGMFGESDSISFWRQNSLPAPPGVETEQGEAVVVVDHFQQLWSEIEGQRYDLE